jgi:hypothetical protein
MEGASLSPDGAATLGPSTAQWEGCWQLELLRARQEACMLEEEHRAKRAVESRVRGACVRLHVQQLACWVQADALRALALGIQVSGVPTGGSELGYGDAGGLSAPFEESAHAQARERHDSCAAALYALRSSPELVVLALRRAGLLRERCPAAEQQVATQFMLCSLYGNRGHPADEHALMGLFASLASAGPEGDDTGAAHDDAGVLLKSGLFSTFVSSYLRTMPGGTSWLQATLGAQFASILDESDGGLRLLIDAMDAYLSLSADAKAEVDRDVERGEAAALGEHVRVVEVLSARSDALCARCECVLEAVLAGMGSAPAGGGGQVAAAVTRSGLAARRRTVTAARASWASSS